MSIPRFIEEKREEYYSKPAWAELANFSNPSAGPSPKPVINIHEELEILLGKMKVEKNTEELNFIVNIAKELFNKKFENKATPLEFKKLENELNSSLETAKEFQLKIDILDLQKKCDDLIKKLKVAPKEERTKLENELTDKLGKLNKLVPALKTKDEQIKLIIEDFKKTIEETKSNPDQELSQDKEEKANPEMQKGRDYAGELKRALLSIGEPGERYVMEHVIKNYAGIVKQESQNANVENALEADTDEEYGQIPQQIDPNSPTDTQDEERARRSPSDKLKNPFNTNFEP